MDYSSHNASRLEDLLASKTFAELSAGEKSFVLKELGSEEEYNSLRKVSSALVADKADLSPDPRTLHSLRRELRNTRSRESWASRFLAWQIPGYSLVPMVVIILFIGLRGMNDSTFEAQPPPILVSKVDTVFIKTASDTVFIEKVIVRYRKEEPAEKPAPSYSIVRNVSEQKDDEEGVTMKDKEELETLLVSGS